MKKIVGFQYYCPDRSRFPVKLICCIAFELTLRACCLLKSIGIILQIFFEIKIV